VKKERKSKRPSDWKLFFIVVLVTIVPVVSTIVIVIVSSRPSLAMRTFPRSCPGANAIAVDWPTLDHLTKRGTTSAREIFISDVCLPGYMIQSDDPMDRNRSLREFLLVPNPGNWLHPPHLDDGDVVVVKMRGGLRTPLLARRAVWAQGKLSLAPVKTDRVEARFQLDASSVRELKDLP
jgi:hypothetical protein